MTAQLHRRGFLQSVVVTAVIAGCAAGEDSLSRGRSALRSSPYFPQSIASGDPRSKSVVLWTRVEDLARSGQDLSISLEVATDEDFTTIVASHENLPALAANDGNVKVKLTGLDPHTYYFYRFFYVAGDGQTYSTNIGRTKTAPNEKANFPNAHQKIRIAVASCQSQKDRYYHVWQRLLDVNPALDAVVFMGDYVYETTGGSGDRRTSFTAPTEAIVTSRNADGSPRTLAANSLSNYRDLYKQYRTDEVLQQIHERWPMIATWDDHEFSDDGFMDNATYSDGKNPAADRVEGRKQRAERVFFEFMPIDVNDSPDGVMDPSEAAVYPNTKIWRDFQFGRHVKIAMADYRTNRPDCLIPLDGFPATVICDATEMATSGLKQYLGGGSFAYVNIDAPQYAVHKAVLTATVTGLEQQAGIVAPLYPSTEASARAAKKVQGNLALAFVNPLLASQNRLTTAPFTVPSANGTVTVTLSGTRSLFAVGNHVEIVNGGGQYLITAAAGSTYTLRYLRGGTPGATVAAGTRVNAFIPTSGQTQGLAYIHFGKQDLYGQRGSHYIINKDVYDLWSAYQYQKSGRQTENVFGDVQDAWVKSSIESDIKWKIIGSSVSMTEMAINLAKPDVTDPNLRAKWYTNVDSWDGFRNKKKELTRAASDSAETTIFVSGDVHSSFVSVEDGAICVTAPAIASRPFQQQMDEDVRAAGYTPESTDAGKRAVYKYTVTQLDESFQEQNPGIVWSDNKSNGVTVLEFGKDEAEVTYYLSKGENTFKPYGHADIASGFSEKKFTIRNNRVTAE